MYEGTTRIQKVRRRELIDAAMDVISVEGLTGTTLAKVASKVGLTAAMINFHFDSKRALLEVVFRDVLEEFLERTTIALNEGENEPVKALHQFIDVHFDKDLFQPRKIAVWYAFLSDASAREIYMSVVKSSPQRYQTASRERIATILDGFLPHEDADILANGLIAMIDIHWQNRLLEPDVFDESLARSECHRYLDLVLPVGFPG